MKKLLYSNQMAAITGILAVIIFFVWGWLEGTYSHAWIIFIVAALANVVIRGMKSGDEEYKKKADKDDKDE